MAGARVTVILDGSEPIKKLMRVGATFEEFKKKIEESFEINFTGLTLEPTGGAEIEDLDLIDNGDTLYLKAPTSLSAVSRQSMKKSGTTGNSHEDEENSKDKKKLNESDTKDTEKFLKDYRNDLQVDYKIEGAIHFFGFYGLDYQQAISLYRTNISKHKGEANQTVINQYLNSINQTVNTLTTPIEIKDFGETISEIDCGANTIVCTTNDGKIYTQGAKSIDLNCVGVKEDQAKKYLISEDSERPVYDLSKGRLSKQKIVKTSSGLFHTIGYSSSNKVVSFGYNINCSMNGADPAAVAEALTKGEPQLSGQLGIEEKRANIPAAMSGISGKVLSCSSGAAHSMILTENGLYGTGLNKEGQIGPFSDIVPTPVLLEEGLRGKMITSVACGSHHTLCVDQNGWVFSWGFNNKGQLGFETKDSFTRNPLRIASLTEIEIRSVSAGNSHSLALLKTGHLYSWGDNTYGQLGRKIKKQFTSEPGEILAFAETNVLVSVNCGTNNCIGVSIFGIPFIWGEFSNKSLTSNQDLPRKLKWKDSDLKFFGDANCGSNHYVLLEDKNLSKCMRNLESISNHSEENEAEITKMILEIPVHLMKPLQARVEFKRASLNGCDTDLQLNYKSFYLISLFKNPDNYPWIQTSVDFIQFPDDDAALFVLKIQNLGPKSVKIKPNLKFLKDSTNFKIEPKNIEIKSKSSKTFEITKMRPTVGLDVISFMCQNSKEDKSKNVFHHFVVSNTLSNSKIKYFSDNANSVYKVFCDIMDQSFTGRTTQSRLSESGSRADSSDDLTESKSTKKGNKMGKFLRKKGKKSNNSSLDEVPSFRRRKSNRSFESSFSESEGSEIERSEVTTKGLKSRPKIDWNTAEIELFERLGTGGSGAVVYRCNIDGFSCAVKILQTDENCDEVAASFVEEIDIIETLEHKNIVKYLGHDNFDGKIRLFMEYYPYSLTKILKNRRKDGKLIPSLEMYKIALGIAQGLLFLHTHNPPLIHRDIKGGNVLIALDEADRVKLIKVTDFDISKILHNGVQAKTVAGTLGYMAPEIYERKPYTIAVDVWSFGMVICELLTLRSPYHSVDRNDVPELCQKGILPDLSEEILQREKLATLIKIFRKCCKVDPSKRPALTTIIKRIKKEVGDQLPPGF